MDDPNLKREITTGNDKFEIRFVGIGWIKGRQRFREYAWVNAKGDRYRQDSAGNWHRA